MEATGGTITYTDQDGLNPRTTPYSGGYVVHKFIGSGTFTVTKGGSCEYLVVAGGGAGGTWCGGGGGAGGVKAGTITLTSGEKTIIVGGGGAQPIANADGASGDNSVFDSITAHGGGGGSGYNNDGKDGGSGGGGAHNTGNPGGLGTAYFPVPTEAYTSDDYTKLLLHADGTDQTFVDSSGSAHTITANGNATQSATQSKFGGKSAYFDGNGDSVNMPASADNNFGSGDFTIDLWIKTTQTTQYATIVSKTPSSFSTGMWSLMLNHTTAGDIAFYANEYSGVAPIVRTAGSLANTGNWVHIALVRYGDVWSIYVDGILKASATAAKTITDLNSAVYVGQDQNYSRYFSGYIDEVRISKGIARFQSELMREGYNGGGGGVGTTGGGGGGGGAGEIGNADGAGYGGDGISSSITGTPTYYGGGGGGYQQVNNANIKPGGDGGGGAGGSSNDVGGTLNGAPGTDGLGGGGGGGHYANYGMFGGAGGSGIVIIRYRYMVYRQEFNRETYLPFRGRSRDLPTGLIREQIS